MKIQPSFWTAVFSDKSTYWDFRLSTYGEINLLLVSSINLILSGNPKKTHRSKYTTSLLFNSLERNDSRTFKSSNCRNIFLQRVCYCAIWFDKCFLFHIITGRLWFFMEIYRYLEVLFNWHGLGFFGKSDLKKVYILFYFLHIITMLIPNF